MKKILLSVVLLLSFFVVSAQMVGGGSKQETKTTKVQKDNKRSFYIAFGYRTAVGSLGKSVSEDGWGGKSGFGIDVGKQWKIADLQIDGLSMGIDASFIKFDMLFLDKELYNSSIYNDSGVLTTGGTYIGAYVSYNVPNTDFIFDLIYKVGFNYMYYHYNFRDNYNASASGFALRNNFGVNLRYKVLMINMGFDWAGTTKDIDIIYDYETVYTYKDTRIPTGMFKMSLGFIF